MPLRAMTRMVASWIDWTRNSWTTSSFERMFTALNARSVNQNFRSEVKEEGAGDTEDLQYDRREWRQVMKVGPYRFFFYASDRGEPPHVHVERENMVAKFWLDPARLSRSGDFGRTEIRRIEQLIEQHKPMLLEAWHDFFDH